MAIDRSLKEVLIAEIEKFPNIIPENSGNMFSGSSVQPYYQQYSWSTKAE